MFCSTLLYVELAPQDVWREYARVIEKRKALGFLPPLMTQRRTSLEQILETQIRTLALSLRPGTIDNYRAMARRFLAYLCAAFLQVRRLSQLRRDPHLLGWFRSLSEQQPPLRNPTRSNYLIKLRRLLDDLAANDHPVQPPHHS